MNLFQKHSMKKDLGWANGWKETPPEVLEAREKGYPITETYTRGNTTRYDCEELCFCYFVDSRD